MRSKIEEVLIGFLLVGLIVLIAGVGFWWRSDPIPRGHSLETDLGCHDCHSPKVLGPDGRLVPDPARLLSGHPAEAPYPVWTSSDATQQHT